MTVQDRINGHWTGLANRMFEQAGLADVTLTPLTTILELGQRYGVADNHEVQWQYLVTGHR